MSDIFKYIARQGRSLYKEKGSKFIGIADNAEDNVHFKQTLEELRKEFHDARHICYGFSFGIEKFEEGKSDDGEPAHSAGDPILGQIHASQIRNAAIFVVRYFGGTKLGVGGLKQAYKTAAHEAIQDALIKEKLIAHPFRIQFSYDQSSIVMKSITDFEGKVIRQDYSEKCEVQVEIPKSISNEFQRQLESLNYLGVRIKSLN